MSPQGEDRPPERPADEDGAPTTPSTARTRRGAQEQATVPAQRTGGPAPAQAGEAGAAPTTRSTARGPACATACASPTWRRCGASAVPGRRPRPAAGGISGGEGRRRWLRWVLVAVRRLAAAQLRRLRDLGPDPEGQARRLRQGRPRRRAGPCWRVRTSSSSAATAAATGRRTPAAPRARVRPRADTIMVLHASLTSFRKLSIPRDTYAAIPDCGSQKINASLACNTNSPDGNPASTIKHRRELPRDRHQPHRDHRLRRLRRLHQHACGGIDVRHRERRSAATSTAASTRAASRSSCRRASTRSRATRPSRCARIRKNNCDPSENDLDRAARQQVILNGIKGRLTDPLRLPYNFIKGPWIGWNAPKAFISDMGGLTLPQVAHRGDLRRQRRHQRPRRARTPAPAPAAASSSARASAAARSRS